MRIVKLSEILIKIICVLLMHPIPVASTFTTSFFTPKAREWSYNHFLYPGKARGWPGMLPVYPPFNEAIGSCQRMHFLSCESREVFKMTFIVTFTTGCRQWACCAVILPAIFLSVFPRTICLYNRACCILSICKRYFSLHILILSFTLSIDTHFLSYILVS